MIVDDFLNSLRNFMYGDSIDYPSHIAIGTGTTAATASDTTLQTEIYPNGASRSTIDFRTKPASKKVRYQMNVAAGEGNGYTLTEVGALNAVSGGTLMNHSVHGGIVKTSSFELVYQIVTELSDV